MSEVVNRDELERRLARVIGRNQRSGLMQLIDLLGNPPLISNVPPSYWESGWKELAAEVEPVLMDIYLGQAAAFIETSTVGVSWDLVNKGAAEYARKYGYDLVKDIVNNTRNGITELLQGLQETIPNFYEDGLSLGQLEERLSRWFSPVRSEMIAITETTRAASEAERLMVELIKQETGAGLVPLWQTNNDERVCMICGPRHGKQITDGMYPPAHPRCRCWVAHEFPQEAI